MTARDRPVPGTVGDPARIAGRPVLVLVDVQGVFAPETGGGLTDMDDVPQRLARIRALVPAARAAGVPVVFIQEVHKRSLVDIGRELDGAEGPHCIEDDPSTALVAGLDPRPDEFLIRKRRYSAFFGTELEIVLKAHRAGTVLLAGGLTDVCIHYTTADAHQHDHRFRVATDAVVGSSRRAHDAAIEAMRYLQRDAPVTTAALLAAFAGLAGHAVPGRDGMDDRPNRTGFVAPAGDGRLDVVTTT